MKEVKIHAQHTVEQLVSNAHLACQVGSGSAAVYATPMMIALMEQAAAACLAPFLEEGETSVGTRLEISHLSATPQGMRVEASAQILAAEGRCVTFSVSARDDAGEIGCGTHQRVVVNQSRFEQRAQAKLEK